MNAVSLALASIRTRPLHALLCMTATAAGIALLCAVFLLSQAIGAGFIRNARGIDIVAGTKGSPLQLVLSAVYHADIPAGNIEMSDYEELRRNPHVRQAIPLALGDNYKGFRMVGTNADYLALYDAHFAQGRVFAAPFEAVAGADTGLAVGQSFAVAHGFSADSDDIHDFHLYTITGVLQPTGTVLDKLLLTTVGSVQELHAHHEEHAEGEEEEDPAEEAAEMALAHQVTAVLLKLRSPIDRMNLPRQINESAHVMAAVPSYEIARFTKSLGIGRGLIVVLGAGFVALSALMLLASLASGLALRRYDLAVLRVLGASPRRLSATVLAEGLILSGGGAVAGIIGGHLIAYATALSVGTLRSVVLPHTLLLPGPADGAFLLVGLCAGALAALVPAVTAARTDIAGLLARGRA
jgi:putative ABC transport system permease protein